jgi:hypothetical protein
MAVETLPEDSCGDILRVLRTILGAMQRANQLKSFGVCKTCRHHRLEEEGSRWCALTREPLLSADAEKICREHTTSEPVAAVTTA